MSTMADYYAPDETPIERDPTPEEMDANAPPEERLLRHVGRLRYVVEGASAHIWLNDVEAYLKQAIERRDAPDERDYDADFTDPFGEGE